MLDQALAGRIIAAIDESTVLPVTQAALRIPSFAGKERALAEFFGERMADLGLEVQLPEVEPGRPNAIGVWRGRGGGQSLLFNGHLDHNMVCEGWTRDPFAADVADGWVYALGVANMKGADAAYLAALDGLRRAGSRCAATWWSSTWSASWRAARALSTRSGWASGPITSWTASRPSWPS